MIDVLGIISTELTALGVPYEFMRWTSEAVDTYFVGEYTEIPTFTEDGYKEGTILLTGTTVGGWLELEQLKEKIKNHFPNGFGKRFTTEDGVVVIYYSHSFPVDTGEAELKRIQINLDVQMWKGAK